MKKVLFGVVVGLALGYFVGFRDAQHHKHNLLQRAVASVGGSHRGSYGNDIDHIADQVDR